MKKFFEEYCMGIIIMIIIAVLLVLGIYTQNYFESELKKGKSNNITTTEKEDNERNEFGFYFDKKYLVTKEKDYAGEGDSFIVFYKNGSAKLTFVLDEKYYEKNKEQMKADYNVENYEEANEVMNEGYKILNEDIYKAGEFYYENLSIIRKDTDKLIWCFSEDGKQVFYNEKDKEKGIVYATLVE